MDIVLIPCWRRADFLTVTLRHVVAAASARKHYVVFLADVGASPGVLRVAQRCPLRHEIVMARERPMRGNSHNILGGYAYASAIAPKLKANLVYLIEEDIWIGRDFFAFHEAAHACQRSFFVSGVRNQNDLRALPHDRSRIYLDSRYQSLGVSFRVESLPRITAHHCPEYYAAPQDYVARRFPSSRLGEYFWEQDGLIGRVIEDERLAGIYPFVPRAYHAGFIGYNRSGRAFGGSLERRVAKLESMTDDEANDRAHQYKDIRSCDLTRRRVPPLVLDRAMSLID
jgi:hypothetical protein